MYENNYPNNTYHYQSGGLEQPQMRMNPNQPSPGSNVPQKKKGTGTAKKIAVGICCGLLFGIFAGVGFQAVNTAADFVKDTVGIETHQEEIKPQAEIIKEQPDVVPSGDEIAEILRQENIVSTTVTDVTEVVKNVMPAMVSVNNRYIERISFFGQEYSSEAGSSGSGIIVGKNDTELLLVTNFHVVDSAEELTVQFVDGSQIQAQIKGTDKDKDLAVIAVQLNDMEKGTMNEIAIAQMGDSDALSVGEPVIAIGNALGYGQSVSTGVVSALDRPIAASTMQDQSGVDTEINTFIQTDAAINPGNSGGALLNIKGEVIGINSNKIGGNAIEGMGYAIPISDARPIIEELMSKETRIRVNEDQRGYLGITGIDVTAEYTQLYGAPQGAFVSSVVEGSPASQAGLIRGDIIVAVDDVEITSMDQLRDEISYHAAGETVTLTIMQSSPAGYQPAQVQVTLGRSSQ